MRHFYLLRSDSLHLLQQQVTIAAADGVITEEEERVITNLQRILAVPEEMARPVFYRLEHLKYISSIRQGKLPSAQTSLHLESGELCHLVIYATYHKVNSKSTSLIPGQMIATSKKLLFLTQTGGTEIAWNNIMSVKASSQGVYLQLSRKSGNGFYGVSDPILVEAIIDTSVRIAKRQILGGKTGMDSRHIPQDVRNAVWQGDQGRCVECGAQDYLEYDHIIPHSRGRANTVGNVQLLCRRCNNRKSDRI